MEGAPKGQTFEILRTVWQISKNTSELKTSIFIYFLTSAVLLQFRVFATDYTKELVHNMVF